MWLRRDASVQTHVKSALVMGYLAAQCLVAWAAGHRWNINMRAKRLQMIAMLTCLVGLCMAPLLVTNGSYGFACGCAAACFCIGFSCGVHHQTASTLLQRWCLPAEGWWVTSLDCVVMTIGTTFNCLVLAQLNHTLGWRKIMLLLSVITTVALFAVLLFVTPAPTGNSGRMRLSEAEAYLFRQHGMLADESARDNSDSVSTKTTTDGGRSVWSRSAVASGTLVALVGIEMMTVWR
jgi:MFS family permease